MYKMITCIASEDKAREALQSLQRDYGIQGMVDHFARGFGRSSTAATEELGQQTEKTIISVIVKTTQVDEVFSYLYYAADLDRPHGGIIYVTPVKQSIISPAIDDSSLEQAVEK